MAWQAYRWVWRLESPLYVGLPPAGFLNRTRLYIPARTMWGALTAMLARRNASEAWPDYQGIGTALQQQARFSYLYPAEQVRGRWYSWLPRYVKGQGLCWQRQDGRDLVPHRIFRQRLLSTHPGTAIEPASDTAAEGTLREVEYITPRWRDTGAPIAFVGYVFLRDGNDLYGLKGVKELWVGGESRYGFGRLRLIEWEGSVGDCFGASLDLEGEEPILKEPEFLLAHTLVDKDNLVSGAGALEVVLWWDQDKLYSETPSSLCWAPGSQVKARYRIMKSGVWEKVK